MSSPRKHLFRPLALPWWDFVPLFDWGDPALEDIGAAGFSLLPRRLDAPTLEHARTFLTVRFPSPSLGKALTNEAMIIAPVPTETPPTPPQRATHGQWEHLQTETPAALYGTRSHQSRHGGLRLECHYRLHRQQPIVAWHLKVTNTTRRPLRLESAALLRVGPIQKVRKHRRSDFIPSRFRLFKLQRAPKTQSAYYDLTERFGSLRFHALDALAFHTEEAADPAALARDLPLPEGCTPPAYGALLQPEGGRGLVLLAGAAAFPSRFQLEVNADPLAPGLTLRLVPTEEVVIPPGEAFPLPPTALAWLENPSSA